MLCRMDTIFSARDLMENFRKTVDRRSQESYNSYKTYKVTRKRK